ncbi:hypothetical protein AOLI_G00122380 [Acnodon oligacanthus]
MEPAQTWTSERAGRSEVLSKRTRSSSLRPRGRARTRCVHAPCSVRAMTSCVTACTHSLEGETHATIRRCSAGTFLRPCRGSDVGDVNSTSPDSEDVE